MWNVHRAKRAALLTCGQRSKQLARTIAKDHSEKRLHILAMAAEVFAREGVARASMSEVARNCGISKANIYHYYPSKDALIFDILNSYLSALRDHICSLSLGALPPEDRLYLIICEILLAYEGMDHEHRIQTEGLALLPKSQQEILKGYQRDLVAVVSRILTEITPPQISKDARQIKNITMSVFGMLNWFYKWNPKASRSARESYAKTVASLTLGGIKGHKTA